MYSNEAPGTVRARSEYTYFDVMDDDMEILSDALPILAGIEAVIETKCRRRVEIPAAETGRPETAKEFAARLKDCFVLKGPGEQKKGGIPTEETVETITVDSGEGLTQIGQSPFTEHQSLFTKATPVNHVNPNLDQATLVDLVNSSIGGIDLKKEMHGKFGEDAFFKTILGKPDEYRNFKSEDGLLYILKDWPLLCIPKIMVQGQSTREIIIAEGHSLLAHLGASKTLDYL
jgi:hypothetical protein